MKVFSAIFATLLFGTTCFARPETSGHKLMRDIQTLALKCIVHNYSVSNEGSKLFTSFMNTCPQIKIQDKATALVYLKNETFTIVLRESENSDGGDLNHVLVYNSDRQMVAQRLNVLAFDNIFLGLSGGRSDFAEMNESSN